MKNDMWFEKTCAICGKKKIIQNPVDYLYKFIINGKAQFYCSYTCWRVAEKELYDEEKELKKYRKV